MRLLAALWIAAGALLTSTPAATPVHSQDTPVFAPTTTLPPPPLTLPSTSPWWRVYDCEDTGSWFLVSDGPMGGLGIREGSWVQYGGLTFAPNPGEATPLEQVQVATRIEGGYVPDQDGCENW